MELFGLICREFWVTAREAAGGANTFAVMELIPPDNFRLLIDYIRVSAETLVGVGSGTLITTPSTAPSALISNPPGFLTMMEQGLRGDAAIFGVMVSSLMGIRCKWIVDSIARERFTLVNQDDNAISVLSVHGFLVPSDLPMVERIVV
jgi:hypothetical protein